MLLLGPNRHLASAHRHKHEGGNGLGGDAKEDPAQYLASVVRAGDVVEEKAAGQLDGGFAGLAQP